MATVDTPGVGIELLGPLRVDGVAVSLQRRDEVVLSALAVQTGEVLSAGQLAEALWGETPPASWPKQIHGSVLRLRRALGSTAIETTAAGYRLTVGDGDVDCHRFEELIARGHSLAVDGEFDRAAVAFGRVSIVTSSRWLRYASASSRCVSIAG